MLAVDTAVEQPIRLSDGTEVPVLIWKDDREQDSLFVRDLPGTDDPDRRPENSSEPPSTAFELAMNARQSAAGWGLLLAGLEIRVYRRASGISQQYLAVELDSLVELDEETNWRAFAGIFRAPAFVADTIPRGGSVTLPLDGVTRVLPADDDVVRGSFSNGSSRRRSITCIVCCLRFTLRRATFCRFQTVGHTRPPTQSIT